MKILFISILLVKYCFLSTTSIKISPCAKWNLAALTVAGTGSIDNSTSELRWPAGIFISKLTSALYITDLENDRVLMLKLNESPMAVSIVGYNLQDPVAVYADDDNDETVVYIALQKGHRVEKWLKGASSGIAVGDECRICAGVWLDKEKNLYMTESGRFRVLKWSPNTNTTTVVAGQTDKSGSQDDLLNFPGNIYAHPQDGTVYVTDRVNNRIQKWSKDAQKGVTIAGLSNTTGGGDATRLNNPYDVLVDDESGTVYVVDSFNNRIQRWLSNAAQGDTIVGGFGTGDTSNQLSNPQSLAFDNDGNLYVSDTGNNRIQMFQLIENQPCSPTSSANFFNYRATTVMVLFLFLIVMNMERYQ